ncbi:hypothetical protein Ocin01_04501 [Orchesella cincta]|uniref:Uncharacterized protein n=1 Tax=Orchesella cincta TaxID=48709 RepID=A0A1D2NAA1_ORCCI|nr:hypothetical protein Ocin01_04501 [Orchesella cincta]
MNVSSSSSKHAVENEDEVYLGVTWKDVDKLNDEQFAIIDHPSCWEAIGLSEAKIRNNPRLMKLMNRPRNQIVKLPEASAVVMQFYCANCNGIPFPWAPDASAHLPNKTEEDVSQAVYLCKQGHPICRTCIKSFNNCSFDQIDYRCVYQTKGAQQPKPKTGKPPRSHYLRKIRETIGEFEKGKKACLMERSVFKCMFLTKMVNSTEFACKYFYNWCAFRGCGMELQNHEESCPHAVKQKEPETEQVGESANDDDCEILKLSFDDVVSEGRKMIASALKTHGDQIDKKQLHQRESKYATSPNSESSLQLDDSETDG